MANPFFAGKPHPLVVGHRGVPARFQENTLAGFRHAAALGVPAVECDVRLTRDGRAVVLHDLDLDRLTGEPGRVHDLTWDQLSRRRIQRALPMGIDVHGQPVVVRYDRAEPIALFDDLLAALPATVAINVELKLDLPVWWHVDIGEVAARAIVAAGAADRVIVTSFDIRKLRAARRAAPQLALGFCFDDSMLNFARGVLDRLPILATDYQADDRTPGHNARRALRRLLGADTIGKLARTRVVGAEHTLVGGDTVARMHARGIAIGTHTLFPLGSTTGKPIAPSALSDGEARRLAALGVDWIETDDPERLMAVLARPGAATAARPPSA